MTDHRYSAKRWHLLPEEETRTLGRRREGGAPRLSGDASHRRLVPKDVTRYPPPALRAIRARERNFLGEPQR